MIRWLHMRLGLCPWRVIPLESRPPLHICQRCGSYSFTRKGRKCDF